MAELKDAPWRIVLFDIESVPNVKPALMRDGRSIPNASASNIVQMSFGGFDGTPLVAYRNINPQVDWKVISGFTSYVERCWKAKPGELDAYSKVLPIFAEAMPGVLSALRRALGPRVILVAHNGNQWDFPILRRQMAEAGLKFPFEIKTFDTQFIAKKFRRVDPKDKKWSLGYVYSRAFGEKIKDAHTSEADTKALARILRGHAADHGANTEAECVLQLRFENGMRLAAFDGLVALPDPGTVQKEEPTSFETRFAEMIMLLKEQKGTHKWVDSELGGLFDKMAKLALE